MTKKEFVRKIRLTQNFHSEQETLSTLIKKITDGHPVVDFGNYLVSEIIESINNDMKIEDIDLIPWWLYEDVEKVIWIEDKTKVSVKTPEELYNYIVSCK